MRIRSYLFGCTLGLSLALASTARADTIGPGGCGSCLGSSYTLTYTVTGTNMYDIKLVIDATGFSGGAGNFLNAVALKVVSQATDILALTPISQPAGFGVPTLVGLSAGGCGGGSNGFFCTQNSGVGVPVGAAGDKYTFEYSLTTTAGTLQTGTDASHVKALYVDPTGKQIGITSEDITLTPTSVPEPSSLGLMATGMLGALGAFRSRFSRARTA